MAFLMLAQGDPIGRDLLKKLVLARYGPSPPAMDTLRITYKGRTRASLGPFPLWARVEAVASYRFPLHMRWDFRVRVLRLLSSSYTTTFDGEAVYEQHGLRVTRITEAEQVESARRRAWSETVFFVSPLIASDRVRVEGIDLSAFRAILADYPEDVATVRLSEDHRIREIEIERLDPADGLRKRQYIRPLGELTRVDGLILPERIQRFWDGEMFMELSPVAVVLNPELEADTFTLREETISDILREDEDAESDEETAS